MLSAVLGSKFTFFPRHLENCMKCGIYSNPTDLSPRSKDKVGSVDQKTMMKNGHVSTRPSCFHSEKPLCPPHSLITTLFSQTRALPRGCHVVFWLPRSLRSSTDRGWGRARSVMVKGGRVGSPERKVSRLNQTEETEEDYA